MALAAINPPGSGTLNITEAVYAVNVDPLNPSAGTIGTAANPLVTQTSNLQTTADLTTVKLQISTGTTTVIQAAVAAKKTRVYRMRLEVNAADVITIQDGATVLEEMNFGTGITVRIYDFFTRPWWTGSINTAFQIVTTTTAKVNAIFEYTNAA